MPPIPSAPSGPGRGAGTVTGAQTPPPPRGIRAVALQAGVSVGTVSHVLNHPDRVAAGTRRRVEAAIAALGFSPNRGAADLRRGRRRMIGLVVPDLTNPFFAELADGAASTAAERGYAAVLCTSGGAGPTEAANLQLLVEQQVAGILMTPVGPAPQLPRSDQPGDGPALVLVDRAAAGPGQCSVSVDDVRGGELAVSHLLARGADHVAVVTGPTTVGQCADRLQGARRAAATAGRSPECIVEIPAVEMTVAEGVHVADALLSAPGPPSAVFATNDLLAIGIMRRFGQAGIAIPAQVAVVGYDDLDRSHDLPIALTSVRQPHIELGRRGCQLLLDEIENGPEHRHEQTVFTPELIVRASTQ